MQYRDNVHFPVATFWTDKPLSRVSQDKVYFFSPALRRYSKNIVEGSFVLWLDFDDITEVPKFHVPPSLVVSSGGGFHVYWRVSDFIFSDSLALYLDRLVEFYKADIMARDITRFMRWPGSFNLKYTPVRQSKILFQSDEVLHVDKVMAFPNKKQST
jgi:hypothetical protein